MVSGMEMHDIYDLKTAIFTWFVDDAYFRLAFTEIIQLFFITYEPKDPVLKQLNNRTVRMAKHLKSKALEKGCLKPLCTIKIFMGVIGGRWAEEGDNEDAWSSLERVH